MSDTILDPEQLAEIASGYALKNPAWNLFVEEAVRRIIQRHEATDIDKLIEILEKFAKQEITYEELGAQVDPPIFEMLKEAVCVFRESFHGDREHLESQIRRVIIKRPSRSRSAFLAPPKNGAGSDVDSSVGSQGRDASKSLRVTTRIRRPAQMWSAEESERLRLIMEQQKGLQKIEWTLVAQELGTGRTSAQVAQRWCRVLNPGILRDDWRIEEDGDLLELHEVHQTKWSVIAALLKGRSDTQCRNRFLKLTASINKPWTTDEDATLFACREKNMPWEQIPNVLAFGNKRATVRYPIVCKMRYTELTGIDNDYEEIGIGALETVRDAEAQRDEEMNTNEAGEDVKAQIEHQYKLNEELSEQVQNQFEEIKKLKEQNLEEVTELNQKIDELKERVSDLTQRTFTLEDQLERKNNEIKTLKAQSESSSVATSTGGDADQKAQQLQAEVEDLKRELGNAQRKLEAKNAEVEDLKEKVQHSSENGTNGVEKQENNSSGDEIAALRAQIEKLQLENETLKKEQSDKTAAATTTKPAEKPKTPTAVKPTAKTPTSTKPKTTTDTKSPTTVKPKTPAATKPKAEKPEKPAEKPSGTSPAKRPTTPTATKPKPVAAPTKTTTPPKPAATKKTPTPAVAKTKVVATKESKPAKAEEKKEAPAKEAVEETSAAPQEAKDETF